MLDGLAVRFTDGYAAGANLTKQALQAYRDQDSTAVEDVRWPGIARRIAPDMLDDETWHDLVTRSAALARERGALDAAAVLRESRGRLQRLCVVPHQVGGSELRR